MTRTRAERRTFVLGAVILVVLAFAVYWPSLTGGFIWDDELWTIRNELVQAPDGLARIWFTTQAYDYWPLSYSAFWLQWRLWGADPFGYHIVNLSLHIADVFLIWVMLRRLAVPGAFLAALVFLVHPVNVETVAWIAQLKNTLSMFFMLLAMYWYDRQDVSNPAVPNRRTWYVMSITAFLFAMLSKGSVVMLPFMLLLFAWWRRDRTGRADVLRVLPFLVIGVVLTVVNIWFQTHGGEPIRHATMVERLLGAGAVVWFYLGKALWPVHLSLIYPQWQIDASAWRWWLPFAAAAIVTLVLVWQRQRAWARPLLFAWCFFGLALAPVMGFADVYYMKFSLVADHYQYLALVAVCGGIGAAAAWAASRLTSSGRWPGL